MIALYAELNRIGTYDTWEEIEGWFERITERKNNPTMEEIIDGLNLVSYYIAQGTGTLNGKKYTGSWDLNPTTGAVSKVEWAD